MNKCLKQHLHSLSRSLIAVEEALTTYVQSLASLCEAEIHLKVEEKNIKDFVFIILIEITQLQKFLLRKNKRLAAHFNQHEWPVSEYTFDNCLSLLDCTSKLKHAANSLFLSTRDRKELYDLLEENKQLYKKRFTLFSYQTRSENDPATRWIPHHPSHTKKQDFVL
jgi:hypothetical protein